MRLHETDFTSDRAYWQYDSMMKDFVRLLEQALELCNTQQEVIERLEDTAAKAKRPELV